MFYDRIIKYTDIFIQEMREAFATAMQKLLIFFQQKYWIILDITFKFLTKRKLTMSLVLNNRALVFRAGCAKRLRRSLITAFSLTLLVLLLILYSTRAQETHTKWYICEFTALRIVRITRSTPSQSCNRIGWHPAKRYCPSLSPLKKK